MWPTINYFITAFPAFFLALCRVSAFFMTAPIFREAAIPKRVRLILSLLTTVVIFPLIKTTFQGDVFSLQVMLLVAQQILIGISIGFIFALVFQTALLAGQIIAFQIGLGFAAMNDPSINTEVGFVSRIYWIGMSLLYLAVDGHLELLKIMVSTFHSVPLSGTIAMPEHLNVIFEFVQIMFSSAVSIALPAIFAVLGVNIIFGLMLRSAPQFNIFTVGFPIILVFGFAIIYFDFDANLLKFQDLFKQGFHGVQLLMGQSNG